MNIIMTKKLISESFCKAAVYAPNSGISLAAAAIRGLILTVSHKEQIGELYPQVLKTLVCGTCKELFE